jgi:glycosyltransferase involved in cell wall biosynthesis
MRIAYVCHHARPNYEDAWLSRLPVEHVTFITTDKNPPKNPHPNVTYRTVSFTETGWENYFFASTAKRVFYHDFEQYLEDIDVVIVLEVFSSLSRQFVEYCRRVHKPVVVLVYELISEHPIYKIPRYRGNTRYTLRNADHFIAISKAAKKHLEDLGADPTKVTVVYPGIRLDQFQPDRKKRIDTDIMFLGLLGPHKGIDLVMNVYERLIPDFPDLRLTIVGKGGWHDQVVAFTQKFPQVTYFEAVPNPEVPALLNKHGIYMLPARDTKKLGMRIGAEQFAFSVVEAMACGLAIVTSHVGALPEVVTEQNVVCPQGDAEVLYKETYALLKNAPGLKKLSIYNEKLSKERYDISKQAQQLANVLSSLVKGNPKE